MFKSLKAHKIIESSEDLYAIGHRVVHGGSQYKSSVRITSSVINTIKRLCVLAPLHNPANLAGISACKRLFKGTPQVAVFDTSFHQTMPEKTYSIPLPQSLTRKEKIRKYGFHGINHKYVSEETSRLLKKPKSSIISCHLGNGCSITCIKQGKSVDTSLEFTPTSGIFMGTRTGSLDPGVLLFLSEKKNYSSESLSRLVNKESGFKGLTGTNDVRLIHQKSRFSKKHQLALDMFAYKLAFYISGLSVLLDKIDAIVFTAGIGENAYYLRAATLDMLKQTGVRYNKKKNLRNELDITAKGSKIKVFVIPANEELEIARETIKCLK